MGRGVRAAIFINGDISDYAQSAQWLEPDDLLIAADGGARHLAEMALTPHTIVGDLDSIDPNLLARFQAAGAIVEQHPVAKDATDLELAIQRAIHDGASEILLLGALGGRLDQTFANLLILARRDWSVPLAIAEGGQLARVLRDGESVTLRGAVGGIVSAIALSERVTGINYVGLAYPLTDATMELGSTRGVSNTLASTEARISIDTGILLVVQQVSEQ